MGGVGPNHVVELINGRFAVYNRAGGAPVAASTLDQFWNSAFSGGVTTSSSFDPRILYDSFTSRWFASAVDNAGSANSSYLLAVSSSSDPTASWTGFKIDSDATNTNWSDFPTMGINNDVLTLAGNMFTNAANSFSGTSVVVVDKAALIGGTLTQTSFQNQSVGSTGFTMQPVWDLDNGSLTQSLLSSFNKSAGSLKVSNIGGTAAAPTLNTAGGAIAVTARSAPPTIDQPGAKANIHAGDSRFSGNVIKQQITGRAVASLWGVQSVSVNGRAAIEWYEIDSVTNAIVQSGLIQDVALGFNFPSIAVNDFGEIVIGFSGADATSTFMSTYYVGGQTIGGVTTFGAIQQTQAGLADYQILDGSGRNRWGDYSATMLDPNDQRHFWTFQEYASASNQYSIRITEIIFSASAVPEPSMAGMLLFAGLGLTARRRRKN